MRRSKGALGLALLAIVALAMSLTAGAAAGAAGHGTAVAAKKKCKKKKARSAKKKKCKKPTVTPAPAPSTTSPLVRATLTWGGGDGPSTQDMDLHVYDSNGYEAGDAADGVTRSDAIPSTTLSPDAKGTSGSETFTDNAPQPMRAFSFVVCNLGAGPGFHTPFTIIYVTADGVSHTDSQNPLGGTDFLYQGGSSIPANPCHRA
jgi:hypothetical protein